ncbi:MAG: phage holin family protein [Thermoleophilia bacterium]
MAAESPTQDLAQTVQDIGERVTLLVHEEIELAKAEVAGKVTKLLRGIVIGLAAGIFVIVGLLFLLHGMAWLAWYALPVDTGSIFWGFFVVAGLLFLLGGLAGYLAAKFFKDSTPPVPEMAIDEAGKIRRTLMRRKKR